MHSKLGRHRAVGLAWNEDREIAIDERVTGFPYLETAIHEVMHVQNPRWGEDMVEEKAKELADVLWKLNFRWCDLK